MFLATIAVCSAGKGGFPPAGTLLTTVNTPLPTIPWSSDDYDSGDYIYALSIDTNTYADGAGGTYETTIYNDESANGATIIDYDGGCDSYQLFVIYINSESEGPTYEIINESNNDPCNPCLDAGILEHFETINTPQVNSSNACGVSEFTFASTADKNFYTDGSCGTYWDGNWVNIVEEIANDTLIHSEGGGCCESYCYLYYDNSSGQPSYRTEEGYDDSCCDDPCDGCSPVGTLESTGTGTAWANTVDAEGTDWQINYYDYQLSDGCCGDYSERHWFSDVSPPVELSSPDGGVSPNPPAGYVLTASAIDGGVDENTYALYANDEEWTTMTWLVTAQDGGYHGNYPWQSYKIVADGSGGSTNDQSVQDAGTVMSDAFATFGSTYAKFYATGITFNDGINGIHPSFDIISCGAYGSNQTSYASNVDWEIEITLEILGTYYNLRVGTKDQDKVDDGECGRTTIDVSFTSEPVNTLLYDETTSSYYYYSDGAGGYYAEFYG